MDAEPTKSTAPAEIFRFNLETITDKHGTGWVAQKIGLKRKSKTIYRWLKKGIEWPDRRTQTAIEELAKLAGLSDWHDLWRENYERVNQEAHERLDAWIKDPYMRDATKAALGELAKRANRKNKVAPLIDPCFCKLSSEQLARIAKLTTGNPNWVIETAVEEYFKAPETFDPLAFLLSLADKTYG